jgi:demethylmenaquinone methyltransferase/2-methoxy-6-polyprenyl-1,4-benzoquinol methylase
VRGVFDSVASKYDVMNDLMSGGLHRAWKAYTVMVANLKEGDQVLDIAGGTGDLSLAFPRRWATRPWCTPTSTKPCCAWGATA